MQGDAERGSRPDDRREAHRAPPPGLGALLRGRFTGLAAVLVVLSFCATVIPEERVRALVIDLSFTVLLLFAIRSLRGMLRAVAVLLAVPAVIGHWTLHLPASPLPPVAVFVSSLLFLAFLTVVMLHAVLRDQQVTTDTLVGAVSAYFLLGVTWGVAYALIALLSPDAFYVSPTLARVAGWQPPAWPLTPLLQYYSLATLSTVGYGDMSPLSAPARSLSVLESLVGPLYLAILISRLVGMHVARATDR